MNRTIVLLFLLLATPASAEEWSTDISPSIMMFDVKPSTEISISSADGKHATVDWSDGTVRFSGDMPVDDAAKVFFESVARQAGCAK